MKTEVNPIDVQSYLEGVDYPTDKRSLIKHAKEKGATNEVVHALKGLADKQYSNPTEVSSELGAQGDSEDM